MRRLRLWGILMMVMGLSFVLFNGWLVELEDTIEAYAAVQEVQPADAAVVLGAAVYRGWPSPVFRERINHAINLYEADMIDYLIFTGGLGYGDEITEAEAARAYALARDIPAESILIETESTLTYENLIQARHIVERHNLQTVLIVSDPLHMRRAMTMAQDVGLHAYSAPTPTSRYRTERTQEPFLASETRNYAWYLLTRPLWKARAGL